MREVNLEKIESKIHSDQSLLMVFTTKNDDNKYLYMIFGDYEIDSVKKSDDIYYETVGENEELEFLCEELEFPYPKFYENKLEGYKLDLVTNEISIIDHEDLGRNWCGEPFTICDIPSSVCAAYTQKNSTCSIQYLDDGLKRILDCPVYEKTIMNEKEVPLRMLSNNMDVMQLLMATNRYLYYSCDDIYRMVNANTLETISDINDFVEYKFEESKENFQNGKEKLMWIHPYEAKCHELEKFISTKIYDGENKRFENIDYKNLSSNNEVSLQKTHENTIDSK